MIGSAQVELLDRIQGHGEREALIASEGRFTYDQLFAIAGGVAATLLGEGRDLAEGRVALLAPPGLRYAASLLGIWRAGDLAVPLAVSHPRPELQYVIDDSQTSLLLTTPEFADRLAPIAQERNLPLLTLDLSRPLPERPLPQISSERRAMVVTLAAPPANPRARSSPTTPSGPRWPA